MKPEKAIPITIVTGFLGAGKTSLINHFLQRNQSQCHAVLVNDFGAAKLEVGLTAPDGIIQLVHGCICCSSRAELQAAINQIISTEPSPRKILIEASGVANPSAIGNALEIPELKTRSAVQEIITIVAADQILTLKGEMAQLAETQLVAADLIVVNRVDLVSDGQLKSVLGCLQAVSSGVPIITASQGAVSTNFLEKKHSPAAVIYQDKFYGNKR